MRKIFLFIVPLLFCVFSINAQNKNAEENAALSLVSASKAALKMSAEDLSNSKVLSTYLDEASGGVRRVYLIQTYKGVPVYNQVLVLAFKGDKLISHAGSFNHSIEKLANVNSVMPSVSAESAVQSALSDRGIRAAQMAIAINRKQNGQEVEFGNMGVSQENITARLMWTPIENSKEIRLSWHVYIIPKTTSDYWMVRVDAVNNNILGMDNYTDYDNWGTPDLNSDIKYPAFTYSNMQDAAEKKNFDFKTADDPSLVTTATYRVVPYPAEAPSFPNGAHALRTDPWTAAPGNATTLRWHTGLAAADFSHTRSNNVFAYQDRANDNNGSIADAVTSTSAFPNLTFDFTPNYTVDPTQTTPVPNQQFNTTNLFYWNNVIHDMMYVYGFTEAAFNFQDDNLGRGGAGNDHVNAEAQDGGGTNNANFSTPADGGSGRMQMYLWNGSPQIDGDVDNGIIVHEYGHGISNRLTGGGSGGCLGNAEQMGEGWSDYYGLMFTHNWVTATLNQGFTSPRGIGTYALNQPPTGVGIRGQRYCTDFTINNRVYLASLPAGPHPRGEIWCATLWDMTWNIINQVGTINPNLYNLAGGGGNAIAMKLVTEGLKLQQCSPGFISGRNAILQADQNLYGGLYNCAIWEAFRRRGMGAFASEGSTGSVTDQVPDFTPPITLGATVSASTIPEGSNLNYTNTITTCSAISGYTLRDTLPSNVTYVSGGTYDAATRVVSWSVNQAAGSTNYPFVVNVNPGSYFPPVTLFNEVVATTTIPAAWTTAGSVGTPWSVSTTVSNSAPNSFFVPNLAIAGDQRLATTASFALPINSYPELSFWHRWNTEDGWDGGVVEISTNGGTTWNDVGAANFTLNAYNGGLGAAATNALSGRAAFTGLQNTFINSKINLSSFNGSSVMIRFRFGSDDNTSAPTNPAGWWVDDIVLSYKAAVNMRSSLFNVSNTRVSFKDMVTEITQLTACNPTITQQPVDATVCSGSSTSFTTVATAVGGVTYQWQISTTGIGGPYTNLSNAAPYSNVTTSTLTVNPTTVAMDGHYFRAVVTGTCNPTATSNPARLNVATSSIQGTVTPANTQVCGTTNSGTLTVAGHNGNIVRWESATNPAGPWTAIANTTTTYTFTNITQTMYYRAVSQFGTCGETPSTVATVTFTASSPIVIVADPGTTVCAGDPTRLTVHEGSLTGPLTIPLNAQTGTFTGNVRGYFFTAPANFTMTALRVPTDASAGTQNIAVVRMTGATPPPAFPATTNAFTTLFLTQVNPAVGNIPVNIPILAGEVIAIMGNRVNVNSYSNTPNVTTIAGFPVTLTRMGMQFPLATTAPQALWQEPAGAISRVFFDYTYGSIGPIVNTGTFLWTPATGLSSTTSNPVAASPMNTTTYTVSHNNGAGCIRQANITITVNQRPTVTTQPVATASCVGTTASFTAGATGAGLTYQWQENTAGCTGGTWTNLTNGGAYSNVTTATLTINPVAATMNGYGYRVVVSGTCAPVGTANISNCAVLTVNPLPVVTITPAGPVCGGVAGISGTMLSTASAPPPVPGAVSISSGTINLAVPDNTANGVSHDIAMTGVPANATITNVSVTLNNFSHTYPGDMIIHLRAPNGQILNLYKYGTGLFTGPVSGVPTWGWYGARVSQLGTTPWSNVAVAPFIYNNSTAWRADAINTPVAGPTVQNPTGFVSNATGFAALYSTPASTTGNWTLAMADGGAGDVGTLASWNLTIDYTTPGTTGSPLTYTWSPAAGLYMNAQATVPYIAGTQTPVVYAAPTVATVYTATGTDGTTGCVGTSTILVNYTPPAPVVTPNPVVMCSTDNPVKLKATSSGTPAVWTPAAGLFTDAAGTIAYVAGTAVDSVWTKPALVGTYTYQVTARNSLNILATPTTPMAGGNGNNLVAFNVRNNNAVPVTFTSISSNTFASGAVVSRVFFKPSAIAGSPGPISVANGWTQFGTANNNVTAGSLNLLMTGLTLVIPAGQTYGIALDMTGATFPAYTNGTTIVTYSSGGCDIITGGNVGWGGPAAPGTPANNPRNFNGSVTLVSSGAGTCVSPARSVSVTVNDPATIVTQPTAQTTCTDKVTTFTVAATGTALTYQWQVSTTGAGGPYTNITNGGVYNGATTSTLTITAPPVSMNGYFYRVIVTGAAPCAAATSNVVMLTVNPLPTIVISASNGTRLLPGMSTTLSAVITPSAPAPTGGYSWLRNGVVVGTGATHVVTVDALGDYSLRVTNINGCTNTSNVLSITDSISSRCFIYPNPTDGMFQVRYHSAANNVLPRTLTVFDAKGDRVFTKMYTIGRPYDRMDVDMRAYGKGIYWVEIGDANGNRLTMCRVVIQ